MFCPKCGKELRAGAVFCPGCGVNIQSPVAESAAMQSRGKMDRRLQFFLAAIIGGALYAILSLCVQRILAAYGTNAVIAFAAVKRIVNLVLIVSLAIEAILLFAEEKQNKVIRSVSVVGLVMELSLIIGSLAVPTLLLKLLFLPHDEIYALAIPFLRYFAIAGLIGTLVAALLGFTLRKASVMPDAVILGCAFVASLLFALVCTWLMRRAGIGAALFGIGLGLLHPFIVMVPCSGRMPSGSGVYVPNRQEPPIATYMFCPHCGATFGREKKFCDQCGSALKMTSGPAYNARINSGNAADAPSGGFAALGFFFPVIGLILYLVWKDTLPLRAKSAGKGALIGLIIGVALTIILYGIYFAVLSSLF